MDMSDLKIDMNDMIMTDSPIRFPGLFGDWTFTASSKAIDVGHGVYWYGILIALGLLLALLLCMKERVKYGISEDSLRRAVKELEQKGFIKCCAHNSNLRKADLYQFSIEWKQREPP